MGPLRLVSIVDKFEAKFQFISNDGPLFTFLTDYNAPMFQLVQIDVNKPDKENWKILINEQKDKLDWAARVNRENLALCYIRDVKSVVHIHDFKSGKKLYELPIQIGSITQFSGKEKLSEVFFTFQSFLTPGVIYHVDLSHEKPTPKVFREITVNGLKASDFIMKQEFYESRDGTRIPMFIFHRKELQYDSQNPTLLYGYGGFNCAVMPFFSAARAFFPLAFNGIVAVANIRGGDEYGKTWHEAGMKENKQNVFDDFIAAGEYLIKRNYTCRDKLIIEGYSNGGLLVAACANQRPDLFGCVLGHVG
uniref:Prolyl endopeptidase n=1 Tax=Romanomermis culicivorax TaxID=13658 RepID=A0A915JZH2_ROMCU